MEAIKDTGDTGDKYRLGAFVRRGTGKELRIAAYTLELTIGEIIDILIPKYLPVLLDEEREKFRATQRGLEPLNSPEIEGLDDFSSSEVKESLEELITS